MRRWRNNRLATLASTSGVIEQDVKKETSHLGDDRSK